MWIFNWCKHKFGEIKEGYQYCSKCGIAKVVDCNHVWEERDKTTLVDNMRSANPSTLGWSYIDRCKKCGKINITRTF